MIKNIHIVINTLGVAKTILISLSVLSVIAALTMWVSFEISCLSERGN